VEWKKVKDESSPRPSSATVAASARPAADQRRLVPVLQHMISTMEPVEGKGARLAIVFNGSPLFTGPLGRASRASAVDPGERPMEGIVALPTSSSTTPASPRTSGSCPTQGRGSAGQVILLDARDQWEKMRKSLGDKRKQISEAQIEHITSLRRRPGGRRRRRAPDHAKVKVFRTTDFGYHRITRRAPTQAALRDHRRHPRRAGERPLAGEVGQPRRTGLGVATAPGHGVVERRRPATPARRRPHSRGPMPTTASLVKGIWGAVAVSDPEARCKRPWGGAPDPDLRDYEKCRSTRDIEVYFQREVIPHVPDA
jgi:type I restriction enzyme M protein